MPQQDLQNIIYALIRAIVKGEAEDAMLACDWYALLKVAARQGIKGLVWQGIAVQKKAGRIALDLDSMLEWCGQARNTETQTKELYNTSVEYAANLLPHKCIVLKGIDYARYWPHPLYREFGDLDYWSGDDFQQSNKKAAECGAEIEECTYKHNLINYKGLTIENHQFFTDFNGTKQGKETERILKELIGNEFTPINDTALLSPNPNFTAIFLLRHAQLHFIYEGIALRHVLDWLFFLKAEQDNVQWSKVIPLMRRIKMDAFAGVMTQMSVKYLGLTLNAECKTMLQELFVDNKLLEDFVADITGEQPEVYDMRLHKKALRIIRRAKRMITFRKLLNESYLSKVWQSLIYNSITGIEPKI